MNDRISSWIVSPNTDLNAPLQTAGWSIGNKIFSYEVINRLELLLELDSSASCFGRSVKSRVRGQQDLRNPHFGDLTEGYEKNYDCSTRYPVLIAWICWQAYPKQVGDIVFTYLTWSIGTYLEKTFVLAVLHVWHRFPAELMQWKYNGDPVAILLLTNTVRSHVSALTSYYLC